MKFIYSLLVISSFIFGNSFSQNSKTEWVTRDLADYINYYWLIDNDSTAIALVGFWDKELRTTNFKFQYWDLAKKEITKSVGLYPKLTLSPMQLNTKFNEFFYIIYDTVFFNNMDDFTLKKKIRFPINDINKIWYDYSSNSYCIIAIKSDTVDILRINPGTCDIIYRDTIFVPDYKYTSFSFSENGAYFIINNGNKKLFVYDSKDFKLFYSKSFESVPNKFTVSNSGKYIGINTDNKDEYPLRIYDITDDSKNFFIKNQENSLFEIKFSKDESKVLISSKDVGIYLYEMYNNQPLKIIKRSTIITKAKFCLEENAIVDIGKNRNLIIDNIYDDEFFDLSYFEPFGKNIKLKSARFLDDDQYFLASGFEGKISTRNVITGDIINEYRLNNFATKIINNKHNKIKDTLETISGTNINIIDLSNLSIVKSFDIQYVNDPIAVSENYKWIVGDTYFGGTILTNLVEDIKYSKVIYLDSGRRTSAGAAFSSDSKYLATGGTDNILRVYNLENIYNNQTPILECKYPKIEKPENYMGIFYISFIDNDTKIVTASTDFFRFRVWSAETGELLYEPSCKPEFNKFGEFTAISYIMYRNNYNGYVTADMYGDILLWDNNFNNLSFHSVDKEFGDDPVISFDYNQTTNQLLLGGQHTTTAMIKLDNSVNVEETTEKTNSILSPNPATDFIDIKLNNEASFIASGKVQIFNMLGIEMMSVGTGLDLSTQRINISHLPAGVYYIKIGDRVEKFLKM